MEGTEETEVEETEETEATGQHQHGGTKKRRTYLFAPFLRCSVVILSRSLRLLRLLPLLYLRLPYLRLLTLRFL